MGKVLDALLGLPKSIYFCFKYLPPIIALRLPIILSRHVYLKKMKGNVTIDSSHVSFGLIKIGFGDVGIFDPKFSRTIWQNNGGGVTFKGKANIGHGSRVSINACGNLIVGADFSISAESHIICSKEIEFGSNVLISWQCLIMDTDFHKIFINPTNDISVSAHDNIDQSIYIGDHVWIGCKSTVLKGANVGTDCVIAANSNVVRGIYGKNLILAGNPAKPIKRIKGWEK